MDFAVYVRKRIMCCRLSKLLRSRYALGESLLDVIPYYEELLFLIVTVLVNSLVGVGRAQHASVLYLINGILLLTLHLLSDKTAHLYSGAVKCDLERDSSLIK